VDHKEEQGLCSSVSWPPLFILGGPELAAQAFRAGLVDELYLFVTPIVVGGGKRSLPDNVRLKLELLDERRFGSGMVYLYYRTNRTR
jgi:dihydrofolate reductase